MNTVTRREQLREALTDAAARAIADHGLSGLKARALADEAGCAVGAIYNVVADLDELVLLANARTLVALEKALGAAASVRASRKCSRRVAVFMRIYSSLTIF